MSRTDRADPIEEARRVHRDVSAGMRRLFALLVDVDRDELWRDEGARDTAHWVQMCFGVSLWEAHRWVRAALALEALPVLAAAFADGRIGAAKVLELCRFATPETESDLVRWASGVALGMVRARADAEVRRTREELLEVERSRFLETWYHDEGRRFGFEGELPAAEGAVVERALRRLAERMPAMPGEEDEVHAAARRADALVAMASAQIVDDPDADRATVVVHAPIAALAGAAEGAAVVGGPPVPSETVRRWLCTSRFQTVVEDERGNAVRLGEMSRLAPAWMARQVRYRDRGCRFPGCGMRRFTEVHHVTFWRDGGSTTPSNLVLICSFHHRLVHEHGWTIAGTADEGAVWRRPDGSPHLGPGPPVAIAGAVSA